ncbi:ABC transporter ATP-binding protein [Dactylosporangium sucinum]|uniref:Peptide ABC transporter ATP-binding protein n=1 Tax=Dactylosporangium sucinum TaxID=1424081 RepID=A0A917WHN6_9ACTN|nr:ABC transporter ATP-binding protein [Dactylosporangium sucinum]GGM04761.1 peptide ABC transporter ATP-binding protein [Dactylosporangium sucinum]
MSDAFVQVRDLTVQFPIAGRMIRAVQGLSYDVDLGRTLAIVGESGSGKSVSSLALLGLHDRRRSVITGSISIGGREFVGMPEAKLRHHRGNTAAMIFQDARASLHPYLTVGYQIAEAYRLHHRTTRRAARAHAVDMLGRVGIPHPARRADDYPHEFSGGMCQRVMIAMALVNDPKLLIADEPTTALDVTVQAQILGLIAGLRDEFGSAVILITHDLGVVTDVCDDVLVMYAGRGVEHGPVRSVLGSPTHPYTWGLLESLPSLSGPAGGRLHPIPGAPPDPLEPLPGCPFHARCEFRDRVADGRCRTHLPDLAVRTGDDAHRSRCHLAVPDAVFAAEIAPRLL